MDPLQLNKDRDLSTRGAVPLACALAALLLYAAPALGQGLYAVSAVGLGEELTCLGMSHRNPHFVMVGTASGKIFRTVDGGSTWQIITITPHRSLFFGRESSSDPRMEYALGLPGKSPHLQSWVRSKGLPTSGVNMQQLLVQKGDKMVSINWIEVDWNDENRVYVATVDGLYRSTDKGRTFQRIFQGYTSSAERMVNTVATDPFNPKKVIIGTASGLFVSKLRGIAFRKTMNYYMRSSYIREIIFDPQQKDLVHVAMGGSGMASPDGGKHWITTHWDEWGPRADMQSLSLGPQNIRIMGTRDGVYASWQGGEMGTWQRRGIRFVGHSIIKVLASNNPKVWMAMTHKAVWYTSDSGLNWSKVFQTGGKEIPRWIKSFKGDLRHLWILTNRQVYRVGLPPLVKGKMRRPKKREVAQVPPLFTLHKKILKNKKLWFPDNQKYRERGPLASLLPTISVQGTYTNYSESTTILSYMHRHWPYRYFYSDGDRGMQWNAFAVWDLTRLIFDKRELPHWGRIQRNLSFIRQDIMERTSRLYMEYRRLALIMAYMPPKNTYVRINHQLRIEEISAYLNAISGGYWNKAIGGEKQ